MIESVMNLWKVNLKIKERHSNVFNVVVGTVYLWYSTLSRPHNEILCRFSVSSGS